MRIRSKSWIIACAVVVGFVLGPITAARGNAAGSPYDLAACIRAALAGSPDLGAVAADLSAARAKLEEARARRWGTAEYVQLLGLVNEAKGSVLYSPNDKNDVFQGLGPFTRIDVEVNIPVYTFGKLDAALRAAQEGVQAEQARGDSKRADVILSVKQLYYGLILGRQLADVLHDNLDTLDQALSKTKRRLDEGSSAVTEIDLLKLQAGRARFARGVIEIDASLPLTRSALARAIGLDSAVDFEIADRKLKPIDATIEPLDNYIAEGPSRRPETRALQTGIAAQVARLDLEVAGYYPNVFVTTGFQYAWAGNRTEQTNPFAYDPFNFIAPIWIVGLQWDLNVFMTSAKIDGARAELQRLEAARREAATGLALEVHKAYAGLVQARDSVRVAEDGRKAGRGLLLLTVANFDLGIGEAEELFKAIGVYTEASSDYLRAVYDFNVAVGQLSKAVGRELAGLEY
ncbi:TolC family protein [Candidatus Binatia bacterium]|nr:TolC family protein [Candidatus Binatia bacterium]